MPVDVFQFEKKQNLRLPLLDNFLSDKFEHSNSKLIGPSYGILQQVKCDDFRIEKNKIGRFFF